MYKEIIYSSHEYRDGKIYRNIYPVYPGSCDTFKKVAEASDLDIEIKSFIDSLKPDPSRIYVVAVAMGAGESWSSNVNGDWFGRADLKANHHTFKKNGKVFHLHDNTPKSKSFGEILFSRYNDAMDRVELVFSIIRDEMPDVVRQIENGETVDVSMGTKVAFDVCSICKHQSKKFSEYCEHLKYEMNRIYPDGRKVYAINPNPNFFDISIVDVGADRTAKILAKVAAQHKIVHSAALAEKLSINKENSMDKGVASDLAVEKALPEKLKAYWAALGERADDNSCDIDAREFGGKLNINSLLSMLTDNDIILRPHEFSSLLMDRLGLGDLANSMFNSRELLSGGDDESIPVKLTSGELPLGIPNKYSLERSMSPNHMSMKFRLVAGNKTASAKRKYKIKIAKSKLESAISKSYQNYVKEASRKLIKKSADLLGEILPKFLASIILGKALLEPTSEQSNTAKLYATINSMGNNINLGAADIFGIPISSINKEIGMTESELKFQAEKQLNMIDKLRRGGHREINEYLDSGIKVARMTLSPVHIMANCFNLVKLSSGKSDSEVARDIASISPTATALSLAFKPNFV